MKLPVTKLAYGIEELKQLWSYRETFPIFFSVIHDIFPTHLVLHSIHLENSFICPPLSIVTLEQRLTECAESPHIWRSTCVHRAAALPVDCSYTVISIHVGLSFEFHDMA